MAKKRIEREVRNIKLTKKWFYDYSMVAFYKSFFVSCLTKMDENLIVHNKKKYLWNVCFCNIWIFCEGNIYHKWRFPFTTGPFINFSKRLMSVISGKTLKNARSKKANNKISACHETIDCISKMVRWWSHKNMTNKSFLLLGNSDCS